MEIRLYSAHNGSISKSNVQVEPSNWQNLDWIDIRFNNRDEVVGYFQKHSMYESIMECLSHPDQFPFVSTFDDLTVLSFSISNSTDIFKADYVSVVLGEAFVITIIPASSDLFNERSIKSYNAKTYTNFNFFLFYSLTVKILAHGNENMSLARHRVQEVENKLVKQTDLLISEEVMKCERDISQLSDIIEDQYVGFQFLSSLRSGEFKPMEVERISKVVSGFEPLNKAMLRLEKKSESLRIQYALIQQEKSTRKINLLTIIQAVFVPLTFIAGVYGMNFVNMPELNWPLGYLFVWLLFVVLAGGLMTYFYRKGWFD